MKWLVTFGSVVLVTFWASLAIFIVTWWLAGKEIGEMRSAVALLCTVIGGGIVAVLATIAAVIWTLVQRKRDKIESGLLHAILAEIPQTPNQSSQPTSLTRRD